MKKPHAMMWYPEAWKSSPKVTAMPAAARAGYFDLLCAVWLNGASLPNDDAMLQACARLTPSEWKRHRSSILAMFTVEDGEIKNERLTLEYEKTIAKIEKRKAAADARWADKQKHSKSNANALHMQSNADASRTRSRTRVRDTSPSNEGDTPKPPEPERRGYGEFQSAMLSDDEYQKLQDRLGSQAAAAYIARFDRWVSEAPNAKASGVKRRDRSAYRTILNWWDSDGAKARQNGGLDEAAKRQQRLAADDAAVFQALAEECDDRGRDSWLSEDLPRVRRDDGPRSSQTLLPIAGGSR